jgi:hypothetical protein
MNEKKLTEKKLLDIKKVDLTKLDIVKSGRTIKLMYDKEPFHFCTTTLYTPFGVSSVKKEWSMFEDFSISCSLKTGGDDKSAFEQFMSDFDEKVKELVNDNMNLIDSKGIYNQLEFNNSLKQNGNYPKLIKLQFIRDKNGNFESFVYDEDKKSIWVDDTNISEVITKGKSFKCVIECSKIWMYNGRVGIIWNINQLKFIKAEPFIVMEPEDPVSTKNLYSQLLID